MIKKITAELEPRERVLRALRLAARRLEREEYTILSYHVSLIVKKIETDMEKQNERK